MLQIYHIKKTLKNAEKSVAVYSKWQYSRPPFTFLKKVLNVFGKTDMDYLDILKNTQKVLYFARDTNHLHQVYDLT